MQDKRKRYFIKQKILGALLLAVGIVGIKLLNGDATFLVFIAPFALILIFTKQMVLMDDYYYEINGENPAEGEK